MSFFDDRPTVDHFVFTVVSLLFHRCSKKGQLKRSANLLIESVETESPAILVSSVPDYDGEFAPGRLVILGDAVQLSVN